MEKAGDIGNRGRFFTKKGSKAIAIFVLAAISILILCNILPRPLKVEVVERWTFELTGTEHIGGRYNASIEHFRVWKHNDSFGRDEIVYLYNGTHQRGPFIPPAVRALDWAKNNTANDSKFLCWWPYGHSLRGWAQRDSIITAPSKELADTVFFPERVFDWEKRDKVKDVADALLTTDLNDTAEIMGSYGAKYVLMDNDAFTYMDALCKVLSRKPGDYVEYVPGAGTSFTALGMESALYMFINATSLPGFKLLHEDDLFRIFELTG